MSPKSLYRQKTKTQNVIYGPGVSTTVQRWVLDTVDGVPALEDPERASKVKFTVKTWVKTEDHTPIEDEDDSTVEFQTLSVVPTVTVSTPGVLTASDIRGAVGGESIPGISSTGEKPDAETPSDPSALDEATSGAPSAEPEAPKVDAEGDVIME